MGRNERGFRAGEIEVSERGKGREERERARVTSEANYERERLNFVRMKETTQERMREKELTVSPQQALENAIAIKTNTLLSHLALSLVITHHFPSSSHEEALAPNSPPNNILQITAQLAVIPALQIT